MNRAQKYISVLLERLPKWELTSYDHQTNLDRLRDRISSATDLKGELERLYQVRNFSDFALSLMWIESKVEKGITLEESTLDEETLVFSKFRQAMGIPFTPVQSPPPASFNLSSPQEFQSPQSVPPAPDMGSIWGGGQTSQTATFPGDGIPAGSDQERAFAHLLERFLESVQSGSDDRTSLANDVIIECKTILTSNTVPDDYRQFCQLLVEFLQYITDNQFLDDVRVMNIVSNIQDPFTQWTRNDPGNRAGVLDQAVDILRDFKTMFE